MSKPNDLVQGTLDLLLLKILALEPLHGWAVSLRLKSISGDVLQVTDGSLYPALHKLEQEGWITAEWKQTENNRRGGVFFSTPPGGKKTQTGGRERGGRGMAAAIDGHLGRHPAFRGLGEVMRMEHWWFTARLRLRSILRGRQVERELDEELQFHLEHKIEEGIATGLSPKEARYAAMRAMDGLEQRKEEMRDMRRVHWLTDFLDDARFAIRSLHRTSGLTTFVVITLALGIGMTSATFSMVDALIFRPYPVPHPSGVVTLVSTSHDSGFDDFSYREYLDIRGKTNSYDGVIANADMEAVGFSAEPAATPRVKGGMMVSGNYFHLLGVEPRLGRGFREDEDQVPGRDAVLVLGPDFWKHEFASDPSAVGRIVRLNGMDFTVI